jgi:O-antigen ligase
MAVTSRPGRRNGLLVAPATGDARPARPVPAATGGAMPAPPESLSARIARFIPHIEVHNLWMVVLVVVMVGKAGEWVPLLYGLPVLKIAFVIAALYVNRVSVFYTPVRVLSLPIARLAIAFLTLSIVSFVFSIYKSATLFASYLSVIYLITFVMLVKTTQTFRDVERLIIGLGIAGAGLAIAVVLYSHGSSGRAHLNENFDPNDLAYAIDTVLPVMLALRGRRWGARRLLVTLLVLVMCLGVLLTSSRGGALGLLAVIAAAAAFPLDLDRKGDLKRFSLGGALARLTLLALLGTLMFALVPQSSQEHLSTLTHLEDDYNNSTTLNSSRRVIWTRDVKLALEWPIGYGLATMQAVDGIYGHGTYRATHNSVIQAFLELGALGLYQYLASYFVTWRELGRIAGSLPRDGPQNARVGPQDEGAKWALYCRALKLSLVGNFVAGFFLSQAYSAALWITLAICCSFVRVADANNPGKETGNAVTGKALASAARTPRLSPAGARGWRRPPLRR